LHTKFSRSKTGAKPRIWSGIMGPTVQKVYEMQGITQVY
jgi:hypothetical protein